jgi:hypothetical protein
MRHSKVLCLAIVTGLGASSAVVAQPPCTPDPGTLRSIERSLRSRTARLELADGTKVSPLKEISITPETVSGQLRGQPFEVPFSQVRQIDVLAKRQPLPRLLRGIAIGAGVGALVYFTSKDSEPFQTESSIIGSGAALGGVIGGIVGLAAPALDEEVVCETLADP